MKKITPFFLAILFISLNISAQNQQIIVGKNYVNPNEVTLVAERGVSTTLKFDFNELDLIEVATDYGTAYVMKSAKAPVFLEAGVPELLYLPTAIIIPDVGSAVLDISYNTFTEMENIEIAPSKGNLPRSIDPISVPFVKGDVYQKDAFFPGKLAELNEPFIMRDVRGQTLFVFPVQYNPVTKTLRIYSEITVTVNYTKDEGVNEFTTQKRNPTIEPEFNAMYSRLFINNSVIQQRGYPTGEEGELVIICHPAFMDAMKPYIDWKRTMGRKTTMFSTATTGTTAAAIKSWIANYYNNPANNLAYVLFVGDQPQIPLHPATDAQHSDVEYGKITGGDHYLEILLGRFSAETVAQVQTQVQRTIEYERDLTTAATWLNSAAGIADLQGNGQGHDGGEADYVHMNNIRTRLLNYGYTTVYQEYAGVGGGTSNALISSRFNSGVSMANYCNHGSMTCWTFNAGGSYCISDVNALQNVGKLPYVFSVACNNGELQSGTCFAEGWMRATQGGQPTGAVAFFGATISIGWQPTMTAQDEFVNICLDLPSTYPGGQPGIKRTIAGAMLNGSQKMLMQTNYNSSGMASKMGDYNSWLVFGDPTLNFRTKTPQTMMVSYQSPIFIGATSLTVNCDANGAVAALSYVNDNNEVIIVGTATVSGGVAEINFNVPVSEPMDLKLCVTGFNKVAYISEVSVIPPSGPYIVHQGYSVVGAEKLTYISSNQEIEVTLKNVGIASTSGTLTATITCSDPQIDIITGTAQVASAIAPDGTAIVKFKVSVANDIIDGKTFPLDLSVAAEGIEPWISKLALKTYAPDFKLVKVLVDGVENGSLPKGSLARITAVVENKGGADAYQVMASLNMNNPNLTLACSDVAKGSGIDMAAGETVNFDFFVITSPDMPSGHEANIEFVLTAMYGRSYNAPFKVSNVGSNNFCIPALSTGCTVNDKFTAVKLAKTTTPSSYLINHTPPCSSPNGYGNHTDIVTSLEPGVSYKLDVTMGSGGLQHIKGWIDYNGNNQFETGELLFTGSCAASASTSFTFTVPSDFVPGEQRFRLRCQWNNAITDGCASATTYGQTLDYTVVLPELYPRVQNVEAQLQGNSITVIWDAPEISTTLPIGYNVYRNGSKLNEELLEELSFTETNLEQGVYAYNVKAVYTGNKESFAVMSEVICYFKNCDPPTDLEVTVAAGKTALLKWEAPANIDGAFKGYYIYRDDVKINEEPILETEYSDKNLEIKTYKYQVSASSDDCDETDKTDAVSIIIEPEYCEPPVDVEVFMDEEGTNVVVTWSAPENIDGVLEKYVIFRNEAEIGETLPEVLIYIDPDFEEGDNIYQLKAVYAHCDSNLTAGKALGINNHNTDSFKIYPNPTTGKLTIELRQAQLPNGELRIISVEVYNVLGRKLFEDKENLTVLLSYDLTVFSAGIYFVKITAETGIVTKKIIKH